MTRDARAPVTRQEVQAALAREGLAPLHRLGQHFLVQADLLERIADLARLTPGEVVLEVGPGLGGLTERLLRQGAVVLACEVDRGLASLLPRLLGQPQDLHVLQDDVLESKSALAPRVIAGVEDLVSDQRRDTWKVVSNLPYQISSPFLAALAAWPGTPWERAVVLVQKEVASILRSRPGAADYSPLSFVAALYLQVERGPRLGPECFYPRPRVDSEVVVLTPRIGWRLPPARLLPFARLLFQSRRKVLRSTVPRALAACGHAVPPGDALDAALESAGIRPDQRIDGVAPEAVERLLQAAGGGEDLRG